MDKYDFEHRVVTHTDSLTGENYNAGDVFVIIDRDLPSNSPPVAECPDSFTADRLVKELNKSVDAGGYGRE